jgi:hypothetical protein
LWHLPRVPRPEQRRKWAPEENSASVVVVLASVNG